MGKPRGMLEELLGGVPEDKWEEICVRNGISQDAGRSWSETWAECWRTAKASALNRTGSTLDELHSWTDDKVVEKLAARGGLSTDQVRDGLERLRWAERQDLLESGLSPTYGKPRPELSQSAPKDEIGETLRSELQRAREAAPEATVQPEESNARPRTTGRPSLGHTIEDSLRESLAEVRSAEAAAATTDNTKESSDD